MTNQIVLFLKPMVRTYNYIGLHLKCKWLVKVHKKEDCCLFQENVVTKCYMKPQNMIVFAESFSENKSILNFWYFKHYGQRNIDTGQSVPPGLNTTKFRLVFPFIHIVWILKTGLRNNFQPSNKLCGYTINSVRNRLERKACVAIQLKFL